ncbi:MAG: hypothetical protein U0822_02065 [Anaerolineae bacterium]
MINTAYERVDRAERSYPSFVDVPHARPILTDTGSARALVILAGVLGGLSGLAALLTIMR